MYIPPGLRVMNEFPISVSTKMIKSLTDCNLKIFLAVVGKGSKANPFSEMYEVK